MADGNGPTGPGAMTDGVEERRARRATRRDARKTLNAGRLRQMEAEAAAGAKPGGGGGGVGGGAKPAAGGPEKKRQARNQQTRNQQAGKQQAANADKSGGGDAPKPLARINPNQVPAKQREKKTEVGFVEDDAFEAARIAREARMREIRNELRRRRRWRAMGMLLRFAIFVLIPTAIVGWYYFEKATDMYVSESAMIFKSGSSAAPGGGLLGAVMGSSPTDSVALQEYIKSRDILERLDREHGIISHYQSDEIDELHRLAKDATFDDAFKYYAGGFIRSGKVKVSYDLAEGLVRLSIVAADPESAKRFNAAIISYGEELVNGLNERSRNDGVRAADAQVAKARSDLLDAERRVAAVQEQQNSFSATGEASAIQGEITGLEAQLREIQKQIEQLKTITSNQNDSRFVRYRTDQKIIEEQIAVLRNRLTGGGNIESDGPSMAQLSSELRLAETDVMAANMMYSSALTAKEAALQRAAEQSLYLEVVTRPTEPTKATRPKRLQNTGLVFLVLFATYIIGLLTFSLIREQAAI